MMSRIPIVVFAQVPPPEHGQSRMVQMALQSLQAESETFDVHHINARFSETLDDIGESTWSKGRLILRYLCEAIRLRARVRDPLFYYVPGPVKWSAVLRDWVLLGILRLFYRKVVFHWHAIGQGEWTQGSDRLSLGGPGWLEKLARVISGIVLSHPYASIAVCPTTRTDAGSVGSRREFVVCNGIEDPCSKFEESVLPSRIAKYREIATSPSPCFRILFLSHGTVEKGLLDALESLRLLMQDTPPEWTVALTIAGGICEELQVRFEHEVAKLRESHPESLRIDVLDYVNGGKKSECFRQNEIFLAPSRWESFGLTVVEAMAHGMQIVAAASDGVRGVLPDGYQHLSPVADPQALAKNLQGCCRRILQDPEAAARDAVALRARFLELFQIKDFSSNLLQVLASVGHKPSSVATDQVQVPVASTCSGGVSPSLESNAGDRTTTVHPVAAVCDRRTNPADDQKAVTVIDHDGNSNGDKWAVHGGPRPTEDSTLLTSHPALGTSSTSHSHGAPGGSALPAPGASHSHGEKSLARGGPRPTEDSTLLTSHSALGTSSSENCKLPSGASSPSHPHGAPGGSALPAAGASHSHGEKSLARGGPRPTEDSTLLTSHAALGTSSSENWKLDTSKLPPGTASTSQRFSISASQHLHLSIYLADQNPKLGRSLGISRMTEVILDDLKRRDNVEISLITSRSSLGAGMDGVEEIRLPWSTRSHLLRVLTDQLHPLAGLGRGDGVIHYFPKGFLPLTSALCRPCVVTIHDTIIQYYSDHYPKWRKRVEYQYWATVLRHTLSNADAIMTVSESSRRQIESFMGRHGIPPRPIHVTFESCVYENVPQPEAPEKGGYVIHLASREPHKRTAQLVRWWVDHPRRANGLELHLIGKVPDEVAALAGTCERIVMRPFLDEPVLQQAISRARALAFPSEIEGFGLPAIEAYYLGTPVCHSRATSVEEVLAVATCKGAFTQNDADSFFNALDEVIAMSPEEVRACGLKLRETYATAKVAERMLEVFRGVNAEKLKS